MDFLDIVYTALLVPCLALAFLLVVFVEVNKK